MLEIVSPSSTRIEHLVSVDVKFSGVHIGGGIYFSANHNPTPGGTSTAIPQRSLTGEAESHGTTEIDYTLPTGGEPWNAYRDDIDGDGSLDFVQAGFDMNLQVGDRLASTGEFYDGPSISLLIANDPSDLTGDVTITGYPSAANSLDGTAGTLHQSTGGTLTATGYTEQTVGSDTGGYFTIFDAKVVGGMSGGGTFLEFDANGDGTTQTYLIGTTARGETLGGIDFVQSTAFSPHYSSLATAIEALSGSDARTADDFARMTLLSGQSLGSSNTVVNGQFFHEDIYGGVNADTLNGAGGNDSIYGRGSADEINGGSGEDWIDGGAGSDTLSGGTGADWFASSSFGGIVTDVVSDFEATGGDVIDLSAFFATLDDVIAATTELGDGSIMITLPAGTGGSVEMLDTTISDLTAMNVNVVCFTPGTLIATKEGSVKIESLDVGAPVLTYGEKFKTLRAINMRKLGKQELLDRPNLWPIRISRGALGKGMPEKDLTVSPQHRILVDSKIACRVCGSATLVPACKLLDLDGVERLKPSVGCTYIHLVFDAHEVISANGCWSESFYPGDMALSTLSDTVAREYRSIFGEQASSEFPFTEGKKARNLIARHMKNNKSLQFKNMSQGAAPQ